MPNIVNPRYAVEEIKKKLDANKDGNFDVEDIIILALETPGVHVKRDAFLRRELKEKYPVDVVEKAIKETPAIAGVSLDDINSIADDVIEFERRNVSGLSAVLGAPGGAAMIATIPADIIQYYAFTLRTTQKLLYLYGFPDIESNEEGLILDTHTINQIIICLGIMYGVAGANNAIKGMARALATGVEKKLMDKALTKGTFYPIVKQISKWFGVKMTKTVFAGFFKDLIPFVGGVIGGTITYLSFEPCCKKLQDELKDTSLSNLNHRSSKEEEKIYQDIIDVKEFDEEPNE